MNEVKIGVQIVAHNAHATLREAIDSVLNQDLSSHIYLIDEGSDPAISVLFPEYVNHPNITIFRPEGRIPLYAARNISLQMIIDAGHTFMAVLDADDVCLPDRFLKQLNYLEAHPDIAWLGSWAEIINSNGENIGYIKHPLNHSDILNFLLYNSPFVHPSVMARVEYLKDNFYLDTYNLAEDYELSYRLSQKYKVENLPEFLIKYRMSGHNISSKRVRKQLWVSFLIQLKYHQLFNIIWYYATLRTLLRCISPNFFIFVKQKLKNFKLI